MHVLVCTVPPTTKQKKTFALIEGPTVFELVCTGYLIQGLIGLKPVHPMARFLLPVANRFATDSSVGTTLIYINI